MPDILHVTVKGVTYDVPVVGGGAVSSVNGQTGAVVLDADDVGALPDNTAIPSKTSDLTNDSGFITGYTETDPTVPAWAKASSKPSYTAQEVGALPNTTVIPTKVSDLQNDSGFITGYTETDPTVPSWAKATNKPSYTASEVGAVPMTRTVNGKALSSNISLSASDVGALPSGTAIPSKTSDLTNDSGFITGYTETDPTVPSWAKSGTKPSYTAQEVGAMPAVDDVTLEDDATNGGVISLYDTSANERTRLTAEGLNFYNASGTQTGNYPNNVNLSNLVYFQTYDFNGVSISAGTAGTRAAQRSQSVYKSGYRPIVARLSYVSDSSLANVVPLFGLGDESGLYVNFYRASGGSGTINATVIVAFIRTEVTGVSW